MATKLQYDVYRSVYDEESQRYSDLQAKGKLYLTIITGYLAAVAFKFEDVAKFAERFAVPMYLYTAVAVVLVFGLLATVLAVGIREYEYFFDTEEEIERLDDSAPPPSDDEFLDERIVDLTVRVQGTTSKTTGLRIVFVLLLGHYLQLLFYSLRFLP